MHLTRTLTALLATTLLLISCSSSDDGDSADGGATTTEPSATDPASTEDDAAAGGGTDGENVLIVDGTTYSIASVTCEFDLYENGDVAVIGDFTDGTTVTLSYAPDLEPASNVFEMFVEGDSWSIFNGDSHDTLDVTVGNDQSSVTATAEVGARNGDGLVDAELDVTC